MQHVDAAHFGRYLRLLSYADLSFVDAGDASGHRHVGGLAQAAWRTGLCGGWGLVLVTAVALIHQLLHISSTSVELGGLAAITAVFGYLGIRIASMSDTAWDRPATSKTMSVPAPA